MASSEVQALRAQERTIADELRALIAAWRRFGERAARLGREARGAAPGESVPLMQESIDADRRRAEIEREMSRAHAQFLTTQQALQALGQDPEEYVPPPGDRPTGISQSEFLSKAYWPTW